VSTFLYLKNCDKIGYAQNGKRTEMKNWPQ